MEIPAYEPAESGKRTEYTQRTIPNITQHQIPPKATHKRLVIGVLDLVNARNIFLKRLNQAVNGILRATAATLNPFSAYIWAVTGPMQAATQVRNMF